MAQPLKVFPENPGLILQIHMAAQNHLEFWPLKAPDMHVAQRHMCK